MTREEFEGKIIAACRSWLGVPFLHNGRAKSQGVDCLGLVLCSYKDAGIKIPYWQKYYRPDWWKHAPEQHYMAEIFRLGTKINFDKVLPGDVLTFKGQLLRAAKIDRITHSGIFLGNEEFIHAITGRPVHIASLRDTVWRKTFAQAMRLNMVMDLLGESDVS